MKFLNFLNKIEENKENEFRASKLKIIESSLSKEKNLPSNISKKINDLLKISNKELRLFYSGNKYKFDIVTEDGSGIENLSLPSSKKETLKKHWIRLNSDLSLIQREFEDLIKR